ncbi:helix-turn-helix transcriptional regulator [Pikeienuella piscinae]|uniref:Helix-turn-helix transcriptional regulator n=2 Tax=Pikeienuella piscinae TaxID=2748098 RepID=A0A7M3T7J3_9RHOB|nr:helix-turn-helix transcriptional regulator [Pikeienuella piscinae]
MARGGVNRSALARRAGVDRSTIAQLLSADGARLPGGHLVAGLAAALGVSSDWLLGLTDEPERPGDVIAAAVTITEAARTVSDDQLLRWHREAAGRKIRHVPSTLPDMLKTEEMLRWEYQRTLGKTPDQAVGAMQDRLRLLRGEPSDYEVAMPTAELKACAAGAGYYEGLAAGMRRRQLLSLAEDARAWFPALRLHLFDARRVFSAPVTVFGTMIGVIYVGRIYLAFRSLDRVRSLAAHFDGLVREAEVDARDAPDWIEALAMRIDRD